MNTTFNSHLETAHASKPSRYWGPYLSDRQWGTVREDYSSDGDAWSYFSHDMARYRAYRWGEDGIGGICDKHQRLCFAPAFWNTRDPILKERLFGLTGPEGNHGEDVKELYYYLDATPSHSYLKMLYKYPQQSFPYTELIERNRKATKSEQEYELIDTGIFDDDRYFDIFLEYAKASSCDILIRITAVNRANQPAPLAILPQLWFRNTWSWGCPHPVHPEIKLQEDGTALAHHPQLGDYRLMLRDSSDLNPTWLFTNNETNPNITSSLPTKSGFFKDAFHQWVVQRQTDAVNPAQVGSKLGIVLETTLAAGESRSYDLRLCAVEDAESSNAQQSLGFESFDRVLQQQRDDADQFYANLQQEIDEEDACRIQRQAFAGLIWSKQFYYLDVAQWLEGDPNQPLPDDSRQQVRNHQWIHLRNEDILSMPDTWEYPWYAAWDLAFHCVPFALIDAEFAKQQLVLMTREWYMHPNGQMPAYEWEFSDVNPPVHAWATWRVYQIDRKQQGKSDYAFLERVFHKLLLNFTWWVNRKDKENRNVFQGGFLGLDNIGVFDRSKPLPGGGRIDQADGTAWMAMYSLNMMRIALELAIENPTYQDIASKFFEHFLYIARAMNDIGGSGVGLWDDTDKFYYDILHSPDGSVVPLKVRSLVGLIPLFAVETLEPKLLKKVPEFTKRMEWFLANKPELASLVSRWHEPGLGDRRLLSLLRGHRMKCLLRRMLDEDEFLSDFGVRGLSKHHDQKPYVFHCNGQENVVGYQPAESNSYMFGGNSNWRGPIWFPVNYLLIESLQKFHHYYSDDFKIECPVGSGQMRTILEASNEIARRLTSIFQQDSDGKRPVFRHHPRMQTDPHFRDYLLFYEYFHGDSGRGVGASHQTGWTALIAKLLQPRRKADGSPRNV